MGQSMNRDMVRVTVNLTAELVDQVDSYAERMSVNRTSAVAFLLSQALDSQKAISDLGELLKIMQTQQVQQMKQMQLVDVNED